MIDLTGIDCISYERVSTEGQAGEKQTSLGDQHAATVALAAKLGRTIGHVFQDAGFSGATMDQRPAMRALVASCEASPRPRRRPGFVVVLNDSRWGRFPDSEEATYWRHHLSRLGWSVRFAEQDDVQDDQMRPVMRAIGQTQASLYRKTLQANVRRGTRGTAEQGYWQCIAPFGYRRKVVYPMGRERVLANDTPKATDEKVILVPDLAEAAIVRTLFDRYAAGTDSLASLVEWALVAWPQRKWTRAAVRFLLTNPAYVGDIVWGRMPNERNERGKRSWRPDAEWYGKANAHEAIVSRSVYAKAQSRMASNRRRTRGVRSDWILSGVVSCRCGKPLVSGGGNGVRRDRRKQLTGKRMGFSYRCATRGATSSARCAYGGTVVRGLLEDAVLGQLADVIGSGLHQRQMRAALTRAKASSRRTARTLEQIDRDVEGIRAKQQRLLAAIEADAVSTIEARDRMGALRRDLLTLTAERERLERAGSRGALANDEHEALLALALDFRATAKALKGPALRELIRPWIKSAVFNTTTRELVIEIRRVPSSALLGDDAFDTDGVASSPKARAIVRRVIVGRKVS